MYKRNGAMEALRSHTHVSDMYRKRIAFSVHMHLKALKWVAHWRIKRKRERERYRRYIVASGLGQTKNHGVSFVSGGACDARMKFHRKLVVCWTEAVTRIRSLRHHLGSVFSEILEINFCPNTFESGKKCIKVFLRKIFYLFVLVLVCF